MKGARLLPGTFRITYEGGCATYSNFFLVAWARVVQLLGAQKTTLLPHFAHLWGNLPGNLGLS